MVQWVKGSAITQKDGGLILDGVYLCVTGLKAAKNFERIKGFQTTVYT